MSALPPFIKGFELSSLYFKEAVQPILDSYFPHLDYSAGRLDFGSDVLGFDTPMSRDHDWGPRLILFLDENELKSKRVSILLADNKDILESIALCQHLKTLYLAPIMDDFLDPDPLIDPLTLPEDSS